MLEAVKFDPYFFFLRGAKIKTEFFPSNQHGMYSEVRRIKLCLNYVTVK